MLPYPIVRKFSLASLLLALVAPLTSAEAVDPIRATIDEAWWTQTVDQDGDGFARSFRLNWDPDVTGSADSVEVFEKVFYRFGATNAWRLLHTTTNHLVYSTIFTDTRSVDIAGHTVGLYDYKIEIYRTEEDLPDFARSGRNDIDLLKHAEETSQEDTLVTAGARLARVWWSKTLDADKDGYARSVRLNWDPNVDGNVASIRVQEKIFVRRGSSPTWFLQTTTAPHIITGISADDAQFLDITNHSFGTYDYSVQVYQVGASTPDDVLHSGNTHILRTRLEETRTQDVSKKLYLQHPASGWNAVWLLDRTNWFATLPLPGVSADWKLAGARDFNLDGYVDLLLDNRNNGAGTGRHRLMVQTMGPAKTVLRRNFVKDSQNIPSTWHLGSVNDFTGDRHADLVFLTAERQLVFRLMKNGTNHLTTVWLAGAVPQSLELVGSADFNRDAKNDLLWRTSTGQFAAWFLDGTKITGWNYLFDRQPIPSEWRFAALMDLDNNNQRDLVFQNILGDVAVQLMNQTNLLRTVPIPYTPSENRWDLMAPR
jgi:hypothetical protein